MSTNVSYVVSLQASKSSGTTPSDKSVDVMTSLKQAIDNTLGLGIVHRYELHLTASVRKVIDLSELGNIRTLLLKSDYQFGYSLSETDTTTNPFYLTRTVFIDFNDLEPTTNFNSTDYERPNYITLETQTSLLPPAQTINGTTINVPTLVQVIAVAYTPHPNDT